MVSEGEAVFGHIGDEEWRPELVEGRLLLLLTHYINACIVPLIHWIRMEFVFIVICTCYHEIMILSSSKRH